MAVDAWSVGSTYLSENMQKIPTPRQHSDTRRQQPTSKPIIRYLGLSESWGIAEPQGSPGPPEAQRWAAVSLMPLKEAGAALQIQLHPSGELQSCGLLETPGLKGGPGWEAGKKKGAGCRDQL